MDNSGSASLVVGLAFGSSLAAFAYFCSEEVYWWSIDGLHRWSQHSSATSIYSTLLKRFSRKVKEIEEGHLVAVDCMLLQKLSGVSLLLNCVA